MHLNLFLLSLIETAACFVSAAAIERRTNEPSKKANPTLQRSKSAANLRAGSTELSRSSRTQAGQQVLPEVFSNLQIRPTGTGRTSGPRAGPSRESRSSTSQGKDFVLAHGHKFPPEYAVARADVDVEGPMFLTNRKQLLRNKSIATFASRLGQPSRNPMLSDTRLVASPAAREIHSKKVATAAAWSLEGGSATYAKASHSVGVKVQNQPGTRACILCQQPGGRRTLQHVGDGQSFENIIHNDAPHKGKLQAGVLQLGPGGSMTTGWNTKQLASVRNWERTRLDEYFQPSGPHQLKPTGGVD